MRSEETKQKIRMALLGKPKSEETRRRMSEAAKGRKRSPEEVAKAVAKMAAINRGRKRPGAAGFYITPQGYRMLTQQQGHPLAISHGQLFEHRKVLYDAIGSGYHLCHWGCGSTLTWKDGLEPDHVDGDKLNNNVDNLVPSCRACNRKRSNAGNPIDWSPNG